MAVGVMLGMRVGVGTNEGAVLGMETAVLAGKLIVGMLPSSGNGVGGTSEVGKLAAVRVKKLTVGVKVFTIWVGDGVREGVLVSPLNPVGTDEPTIGTEIRNVRALEDTIFSGSIGRMEMIGS